MAKIIDVNNDGLIKFAKKLDKLSRNALPVAARRTLNSVAFETKKKTLAQEAAKSFENRNPSFYKNFSSVEQAQGFDINRMQSKVGMVDSAKGKSPQAAEDQTQQQVGGRIRGRAFIPMDEARTGGKHSKNVKKKNRISNINIVLDTVKSKGNRSKKKLIQTSIRAINKFGSGVAIKHDTGKRTIVYKVEKGNGFKTRKFSIKLTPLYTYIKGRSVRIKKPIPFVLKAGKRAQLQANKFFRSHAKRALNKVR